MLTWYRTPFQPYSTPATSPPTPARHAELMNSNHRNSPLRNLTRSSKIEKKPPRKKKSSTDSKKLEGKVTALLLDKPLSQQKVPDDLVLTNMEEYVNRGKEVRQREVESGKNPGKVKRPMNAFMLYRKTYQGVAKGWADEHNHQVVSRVCGMSWPMEPEQVREQFKAWAEKERENHQLAFPDYKFTPTKPSKAPKHKDGNESDCSDPDWGPTGSSLRSARALTRARSLTRASSDDFDDHPQYIMGRITYPPYGYSSGSYNTMAALTAHRSAFEYSNPGKAMPAPYEHHSGALRDGSYYEAQVHTPPSRHLHHGMSVEDVVMGRTPSPTMAYSGVHSHGLSMSKVETHNLSQYSQPMFTDHFTGSPASYDLPTQQSQLLKQDQHYDHQHEQKYDPHLEQKYHHHSHDSQHEQKYDIHHHEPKYHLLDEAPRSSIDPSLENVYSTSAGEGIHSMIGNDGGGGGSGDNKNSVMTQVTTSSTQSAWQPHTSGSSGGAGPMASGADSDNGSGSQFVDSFGMYEDEHMRVLSEGNWHVESVDPPLPDGSHFDTSWMMDQPAVADTVTVKTGQVSHTP